MNLIYTLLSFLLAILILVSVHEFGHFWVARKCGVKVLRFAIGLGKPLFSWNGKDGTEYAFAPLPFGGYVKMLDEREDFVPANQLHQSFNRQSLIKRVAIVAAGPIANFILAIVLFWLIAMIGSTTLRPVIGKVQVNSLAYQAGMQIEAEIIAIDDHKVNNWTDINHALISKIGTSGALKITTQNIANQRINEHTLVLNNWLHGTFEPNLLNELGIMPWQPLIPVVFAQIAENSPAALAGLQEGDKIIAVNQIAIVDWQQFIDVIRPKFNQQVEFEIERNGARFTQNIELGFRELEGEQVSYLGAMVRIVDYPADMLHHVRYNPLAAAEQAVKQVWKLSVLTLQGLGKMITGALSAKNLSGPITIAKIAGSTAQIGISAFLYFLAYLSISLGILNLLPIPVLDGGHLFFYILEAVRGKPLSVQVQNLTTQVGMFLIVGLIFVALFNDLSRLVS